MPESLLRFFRMKLGVASAIFIILLVAATLLLPPLFSIAPNAIGPETLRAPSGTHLFGTDELGRDVLLSLIVGVRVSLLVGLAAAVAAAVIGVLVGAWAGFFGGKLDFLLMRVAEIFQVLPTFLLAAVVVAMLGPGLTRIISVIAILSWPQIALVMRSEVLKVKQMEYVDAVRCLGYRESTILLGEVIPNSIRAVLALATLIVGQAILIEASLSFLGLSSPDLISWGHMLYSGQRYLFNAWWLSVLPGLAIFLTVLAFNLLGDAIDATINNREN